MQDHYDDDQLAEAVKYNFKFWWAKLTAIRERSYKERALVYLRALKHLPGSYKLWFHFLTESVEHCKGKCLISASYSTVNGLFERCLVFMHKMPRVWIMYLDFLFSQKLYNKFRATLDKSLTALPLTQHEKIWEPVTEQVKTIKEGDIGRHILERYLKLNQDFMEEYVDYLKSIGDWRNASKCLVQIINDERFVSSKGLTSYEFCMELCQMVSHHPEECVDVDGNAAIRHCIGRFTDEVGNLWNFLAEYFIRQGLFEKARDVFEEALEKVASARDFGLVYSAYLKFEEELLTMAMEEGEDDQETAERLDKEDSDAAYIDNLLQIEQKDRLE